MSAWVHIKSPNFEGPENSVQFKVTGSYITGSNNLTFIPASDSLNLTGTLNVSGTINANQYNVNVTTQTITNISSSGDTKFGNTSDDIHEFTGSLYVSGNISLGSASDHSLTLNTSTVSIPNNLNIDSNTLYINSSNNRIGIGTDSPNEALEINGAIKIGSATNANNGTIRWTGSDVEARKGGAWYSLTDINDTSGDYNWTGTNVFSGALFVGDTSTDVVTFNATTASIPNSLNFDSGTLFIDAANNRVGIGTITPSSHLHVNGTITTTNLAGTITTAAQTNITSVGTLSSLAVTNDLAVDTDTLFVDASTDRVAIGRTDPQKTLEVIDSGGEQLRISYSKHVIGVSENVYSDFHVTSNGYLGILPTGNRVGINTASPDFSLDVSGSARITGDLIVTGTLDVNVADFNITANTLTLGDSLSDQVIYNAATASIPNNLDFTSNGNTLVSVTSTGTNYPTIKFISPSNKSNRLVFNDGSDAGSIRYYHTDNSFRISGDGTDSTEFIRIKNDGNVGIGITNPTAKLYVSGTLLATGTSTLQATTATTLSASSTLHAGGTSTFQAINAQATTATTLSASSTLHVGGTSTLGAVNTQALSSTTIQASSTATITDDLIVDTDTLFVDASADKVGIGRTDPQKTLEVIDSSGAQLRLSYSKYILGVSENVYSDLHVTSNGYLGISPTGNRVGINTTSPEFSLDVSGSARITGDLIVTGSLDVNVADFNISANTLTLGDTITDVVTFNAATASIPNNLNIDSGTLFINSSTNKVGIGTTIPSEKLEVNGAIKIGTTSDTNQGTIRWTGSDLEVRKGGEWASLTSCCAITGSDNTWTGTNYFSGALFFGDDKTDVVTFNSMTASIPNSLNFDSGTLFIDATNNRVGIGTISPSTQLHVNGTVTATNLAGTLSTAAQTNITSVGTLSSLTVTEDLIVDTDTLFVDASTDRVGIGRTDPQKTLEVIDSTGAQLRLSYSKYVFGVSENVYSDLHVDSNGYFKISSTGNRVGIGVSSPSESLEVSGAIKLGTTTNTNNGTIRWTGSDLELRKAGEWTSLTSTSVATGSNNTWTGTNTFTNTTTISGSMVHKRILINTNYTASTSEYFIGVSSSASVGIQLPKADSLTDGQTFTIKDEGGNSNLYSIQINTSGSDSIDGNNFITLESPYSAINLYTNGIDKFFIY